MAAISFLFFMVFMGCWMLVPTDLSWWGLLLRVAVMLISGLLMVLTFPSTTKDR